jgi:hypothetical protein
LTDPKFESYLPPPFLKLFRCFSALMSVSTCLRLRFSFFESFYLKKIKKQLTRKMAHD